MKTAHLMGRLRQWSWGRFWVVSYLMGFLTMPVGGFANPVGEQVVSGAASFDRSVADTLTVNQSTENLITNWQDFSIGANELTRFNQPSSNSLAINRVISGNPSAILGSLQANGRVWVINPNGVVVGSGAKIETNGFMATTLDASNESLLGGGTIQLKGDSTAKVINLGTIDAGAGSVRLLARQVENHGTIRAMEVGLGAGTEIWVQEVGSEHIFVKAGEWKEGCGVDQQGMIDAAVAELKAVGGKIDQLAVRSSGRIENVSRVVKEGGRIFLRASGGRVETSGILKAETVVVTGKAVGILAGSVIDGKKVNIGGGKQGQDVTIENSEKTLVAQGAKISGSEEAIVWSDGQTGFYGELESQGGFSEISGKQNLDYRGSVNLNGGMLLLDPQNLQISTANPGAYTPQTLASSLDQFTDNVAENSWLTPADLLLLLATGSVTLQANTDITFANDVNASGGLYAGRGLTANAGRRVIFNSNVALTLNGGGFTATVNDAGAQAGQRTAGDAYFFMDNGSSITTNGGAVNISAGSFGGTTVGSLVVGGGTTAATISTGSGNITLAGVGVSGTVREGVLLNKGFLSTGSGAISVTGTGFAGTSLNQGVFLYAGSQIASSGSGAVTVTGTGGNGSVSANDGVRLEGAGSLITVVNGNITVNGTAGGTGFSDSGVLVNVGSKITSTGTGSINVTGTGSGASSNNFGIWVTGGGQVASSGTGGITLMGTGGNGDVGGDGVRVDTATSLVTSVIGNIAITGIGQGSAGSNRGVLVYNSGQVTSTGSASITINGTAGSGGPSSHGVWILTNARVDSTSTGTVSITGLSGNGTTDNTGVRIDDNAFVTSVNGNMTINGTGRGSGAANYGVLIYSGAQVNSAGSASISITGTGGNGTSSNIGVWVYNSSQVNSTGSGTITLTGTGGNGTTDNYGVSVHSSSSVNSVTGNIRFTGVSQGTGGAGYGVFLYNTGQVNSTGSANIVLTGTGASGGDNNHGVYLLTAGRVTSTSTGTITINGTGGSASAGNDGVRQDGANSWVTSVNGNIVLNGTGGGTGGSNRGILLYGGGRVISTGTATIAMNGTGGPGGAANRGVLIFDTGGVNTKVASVTGDINITGVGGNGAEGVYLYNSSTVDSTGAAAITLTGTGSQGVIASTGANIIGGASATGAITIIAHDPLGGDSISLSDVIIRTTGVVSLRPLNDSTTIGVGAGAAGIFNLNAADLATITTGNAGIYIGKTTGTGAVDLQAVTWADGVTVLSPGSGSSGITINGIQTAGLNKNLVLASGGMVNNAIGAGALVVSGTGKYYVYAPNEASVTKNGLTASKLYNGTYATLPPSSITQTGSRFIYATSAVLDFTAQDQVMVSGGIAPSLTYTISSGLAGDAIGNVYTGIPTISANTLSEGGEEVIQVGLGTLFSDYNYRFNLVNAKLSVAPSLLDQQFNSSNGGFQSVGEAGSRAVQGQFELVAQAMEGPDETVFRAMGPLRITGGEMIPSESLDLEGYPYLYLASRQGLQEVTGKTIDLQSLPPEQRRKLEEIEVAAVADGNQILKRLFQGK